MARSKAAAASAKPARNAGSRTSAVVESQSRPASAPDVPQGFRAPTAKQTSRFVKLTQNQYAQALDAASEVRTGAATFERDFGRHTPNPSDLADTLESAAQWRREAERAQQWADYALAQSLLQGDAASTLLANLRAPFESAVADEPAIARRYTATGKLLTERSALAKKSVATRARNKRAQSGK